MSVLVVLNNLIDGVDGVPIRLDHGHHEVLFNNGAENDSENNRRK
jgi:hypothetical protein